MPPRQLPFPGAISTMPASTMFVAALCETDANFLEFRARDFFATVNCASDAGARTTYSANARSTDGAMGEG